MKTFVLLLCLLIFAISNKPVGATLQDSTLQYDILGPMIFPYFSLLYEKKNIQTFLYFPGRCNRKCFSFFKIGKKGDKSSIRDLYTVAHHHGENNSIGGFIDEIDFFNDYKSNNYGSDISNSEIAFEGYRTGIWYSQSKFPIIPGISTTIFKNNSSRSYFNLTNIGNSNWIKKRESYTTNHFNFALNSELKFSFPGTCILGYRYIDFELEYEDERIQLNNNYLDTSFTSDNRNSNTHEFLLGYLSQFNRRYLTFYSGFRYKNSDEYHSHKYELKDNIFENLESSSILFESFISKKYSIDRLSIYFAAGATIEAVYYLSDPEDLALSPFWKFRKFSKNYSDLNIKMYCPIFLEYQVHPCLSLFTMWKPSIIYINSKKLNLSEKTSTEAKISEFDLGIHFSVKDKIQFAIVPNFKNSIKLSSLEAIINF